MLNVFKEKIKNRTAKVAIIGLGYVGLPLAVEYAKAGFKVTGIDVDKNKIKSINSGISYIGDVTTEELSRPVKKGLLKATDNFSVLKDQDAIIICVPTPLRKTRDPDISYIVSAAGHIAANAKKGQLVILESTTYPGTTDEVVLPMIEEKGLKVGVDFFLAFSPERIDPANKNFQVKDIPKVVGGITKNCTEAARSLYSQIITKVLPVSSSKAAEMVKLLENTFRSVNIGLVNELALMCNKLGVDAWEVINAAKSKPFGFMAFYPGPGLGGHCIPIDPIYLSWKARLHGFEARFIELADQINSHMPEYVVERTIKILNNKAKKALNGARVLMVGLSYKKNVSDTRESPAFEVMKFLAEHGAIIEYHDPYVNEAKFEGKTLKSKGLTRTILKNSDCVLIITDHDNIDYGLIVEHASLILDTRNALNQFSSEKIIKL